MKACALYITSLSTSKEARLFCAVLLQATADYLVSLLIVSSVEEMKENLICISTPQFVLPEPQRAALIP